MVPEKALMKSMVKGQNMIFITVITVDKYTEASSLSKLEEKHIFTADKMAQKNLHTKM